MTEAAGTAPRATTTPSALLIGYGNPLRGDDGVGWAVAEAVGADTVLEGLRVITVHQLTPELADTIALVERVFFVDAQCDAAPGAIQVRSVTPATAQPAGFTHHHCDPAAVLRLAWQLHGTGPDEAWIITIGAADFQYGERLSPAVEDAVSRARHEILRLLH